MKIKVIENATEAKLNTVLIELKKRIITKITYLRDNDGYLKTAVVEYK